MNIDEIKKKYHSDAAPMNGSTLIQSVAFKLKAQKAVDNLWEACRKARSAVSEYNKNLAKIGQPEKQVFSLIF